MGRKRGKKLRIQSRNRKEAINTTFSGDCQSRDWKKESLEEETIKIQSVLAISCNIFWLLIGFIIEP
jgi:hypothetical protein